MSGLKQGVQYKNKKVLTALIVDDETTVRKAMLHLVQTYCTAISNVFDVSGVDEATTILNKQNIDIVFLDILMPEKNGFHLLPFIDAEKTAVIFTTASSEHAIKAIKYNALDYILKPIDYEELQKAVSKAVHFLRLRQEQKQQLSVYRESLLHFQRQLENVTQKAQMLTIPMNRGFQLIELEKIIYVRADNNYSKFNCVDDVSVLAAKTLGEFEKMLDGLRFVRIHKSTMVNLKYVRGYQHKDGHYVVLHTGKKLVVARRRVPLLLKRIEDFVS